MYCSCVVDLKNTLKFNASVLQMVHVMFLKRVLVFVRDLRGCAKSNKTRPEGNLGLGCSFQGGATK